ncbi:MAG TPA: MauE/DoxX family redox-associated membrane protein, partial [Ornithinicoccus sp.]|nr:MauE/DoxX family redox-associated membrane protein [Ornithinicoccus sp.]
MDISALLTGWLVLAAVLVASGVGKVRHPEGTTEAFVALNVPDALNRPWIITSHPWAEIALAALLLALPHPASVVAAALALALFTAYLMLVWRVVASGEEASCNCFGSVGSGTVDSWTVARNGLLVLVAVVVLVDAALGGSAVARFADLGRGWWWVLGLVVTAAVTYLVTREGAEPQPTADDLGPEEDYLRLPIPDVPVRLEEDTEPVSLRDLAGERAQVLLLLNPGCGPCKMITGKVAGWAREVPEIDFRVLHAMSHENMRQLTPSWEPFYVQEVGGSVGSVFGNP